MTVPSVHCEVKKLAFRQSKEGFVISFVVHPSDMPDALAVAPIGQRYQIVLVMIDDDENPIDPDRSSPPLAERPGVETGSSPTARARASYTNLPPMERARVRACILPTDHRFQQWVAKETAGPSTEEYAAIFIRESCCERGSRRHIATSNECYQRFLAMETEYKLATQQMAEPR